MAIDRLNQGTPTVASQVPFYDTANGRDARMSITDLISLLQGQISGVGFTTQYAAPNVSGYAVNIAPPVQGGPVWLLLTPTGPFANLTLNLPVGSNGQEILISSTQAVTGALTVAGSVVGAAAQPVNGAPATLLANGFFRLRFDGVNNSWYRVG